MRRAVVLFAMILPFAAGMKCTPTATRRLHAHVLNRIGFGPDVWTRERIDDLGWYGYVLEQLEPEQIDDSAFEALLSVYPTLTLDFDTLRTQLCDECPLGDAGAPLREAAEAKLLRAIHSRRQLQAVLEDFWFDHFNVDARVGMATAGIVPYVRDAIRPHVLGRFEDLVLATAQSPAMLEYLDNRRNFREGTIGDSGVPRGINENYARELLELHTLGIEAGFTETDVREVARVFTGWTTGGPGFAFRNPYHDDGPKQILGTIRIEAGGGQEEGELVIRRLARHPATARRISRLLIERFVSEAAPDDLVERAALEYRRSKGDLDRVLRTILLSEEFRDPRHFGTKVKRPAVFLASLLRATAGSTWGRLPSLMADLDHMGEAPYKAPAPTGYPDRSEFWASGGTLLTRLNLANQMSVHGGADWGDLADSPLGRLIRLKDRLLLDRISAATLLEINDLDVELADARDKTRDGTAASIFLSSPGFLHH